MLKKGVIYNNYIYGMMMLELIIFKCLDLQILSLFEFFNNPDICNSALLITLEKAFWMILEPIFDIIPIKVLLYIQSGISMLGFIFSNIILFIKEYNSCKSCLKRVI